MYKKLLSATALMLVVISYSHSAKAEMSAEERISKLEQELAILKRQLEVKEEVATAKAEKTPDISFDKKGLSISSPDKNFTLKAGGYAQFDSRTFLDDSGKDDFLARRIRPVIQGTVAKDFSYRFMPDFGGSSVSIQDAHIDYKADDALSLRAGKFKPPIGLERLQSATDIFFAERGHPSNFSPPRDFGVMAYGDIVKDSLEYQLGIFNGTPDNSNLNNDNDDNKDIVARVFAHPFTGSGSAFEGLGVGVGGSYGKHEGAVGSSNLPAYRTPGQQNFFSYAGGSFADGDLLRIQPQAYYYYGNMGVQGEYAFISQDVSTVAANDSLNHEAWQLAGSYVLTGEDVNYKGGIKPAEIFDPKAGGWGAFELVARVGETDIDDNTFPTFANIATSASKASTIGGGMNWYLNEHIKLVFDYEHTSFDGGAAGGSDRNDEQVIFSRLQFRI